MFLSLEYVESRKHAVVLSMGLHVVLLILLLLVPFIFTGRLNLTKYNVVPLIAPPQKKQIPEVTHWKAPPPPQAAPRRYLVPPPLKPLLTHPELKPPEEPAKPEPVKVPEPKLQPLPTVIETPRIAKAEAPSVAAPKPPVQTGVFSTGSSATPTVNLPANKVQTGGFGDPNGIRGTGRPDKIANIASLGSFDLPVGPGAGNGTGGANGVSGTVLSAGFGNGVATAGGAGNGNGGNGSGKGVVRQGSFGDTQPAATAPQPKKREAEPPTTPVEIIFKPRPEYTDEARRLRLEGEILVRALFTATGEVRVLDVVRGLGHGLNESAIRAAQQIRFKPAERDGRPVDSTATVHIVFQLAY